MNYLIQAVVLIQGKGHYEDINALQISTTYLNTYEQYLNEKT